MHHTGLLWSKSLMSGHTRYPTILSLRRLLAVPMNPSPISLHSLPTQRQLLFVILKFLVVISIIFLITCVCVPKQYIYPFFHLAYFDTCLSLLSSRSPSPWSLPQTPRPGSLTVPASGIALPQPILQIESCHSPNQHSRGSPVLLVQA